MAKQKIGTDFTGGLQMPHYTNGRLLTAEDLESGQETILERQSYYGRGMSAGIIQGLHVSSTSNRNALRVVAGLGINANGDLIRLARDSVILPVQPITPADTSIRRAPTFAACDDIDEDGNPMPLVSGAYLLTAAPTAKLEGTTPRRTVAGADTAVCANQWSVEGITFSIIRLDAYVRPTGNRSQRNRNMLAHWFYGSDTLVDMMLNIFYFNQAYTGYTNIEAGDFTPCDLPLVVFFWSNGQISFVDEWAVRRRLSHPYPATAWQSNISDQRRAEGEARFLQFQTQILEMQQRFGTQTDTIQATRHFAWLPPVGFLPVNPFDLIVDDTFDAALTDDQEAIMERQQLTRTQVLDRVRTTLNSEFSNSTLYRLGEFFQDILPSQYHIVHEDEVHDRLHQSWVQKPIMLPAPAQSGNIFDFILPGDLQVEVTSDNLGAILGTINQGKIYNLYQPMANVESNLTMRDDDDNIFEAINDNINRIRSRRGIRNQPDVEEARTGISDEAINAADNTLSDATSRNVITNAMAGENFMYYAPRDLPLYEYIDDFIYYPPEQQKPDPIIEILVVDELLQPYRDYLLNQMPTRINNAIAALTSNNDAIFVGSSNFAAVTNTISEQFLMRSFLGQAINTGVASSFDLNRLRLNFQTPVFYVVFVRYRPPRRSRPMPGSLRDD